MCVEHRHITPTSSSSGRPCGTQSSPLSPVRHGVFKNQSSCQPTTTRFSWFSLSLSFSFSSWMVDRKSGRCALHTSSPAPPLLPSTKKKTSTIGKKREKQTTSYPSRGAEGIRPRGGFSCTSCFFCFPFLGRRLGWVESNRLVDGLLESGPSLHRCFVSH